MLGLNDFNIDDIKALADVLNEKKLDRIEIKNGDAAIAIEAHTMPPKPAVPPIMPSIGVAAPAQVQAPAEQPAKTSAVISGNVIKAPIVGTYYSAPAPDKPPFIKVGQKVFKGDTVMIIESMKLMNEIQSEFTGVVEKILVENGQAVEFDQPLVIIK